MATTTLTKTRPGNPLPLMLLLALLALAAIVIGTQYSHAYAKHGQDAINAQHCFDRHRQAVGGLVVSPYIGGWLMRYLTPSLPLPDVGLNALWGIY